MPLVCILTRSVSLISELLGGNVCVVENCVCQWVFLHWWSIMCHLFWENVEWFWSTKWLWCIRWGNSTLGYQVSTPCMYWVSLLVSTICKLCIRCSEFFCLLVLSANHR